MNNFFHSSLAFFSSQHLKVFHLMINCHFLREAFKAIKITIFAFYYRIYKLSALNFLKKFVELHYETYNIQLMFQFFLKYQIV